MAEHEETSFEAASKRTFESASPFYPRTALHREPQTIEGQATEEPPIEGSIAPGFDTSGVYSQPAEASDSPSVRGFTAEPVREAPRPEPDRPPHAAPAAPRVKRGLSPVALLIAAIVGALAGFAGAYAAHEMLNDTQNMTMQNNLAAFDQRLSALNTKLTADEKKIDTAGSTNRDALSAVEKRLGTAETSAKTALALATAAQTQTAAAGTTEAPAGSPAPVVVAPVPMPDLAPLQSRIDTLDQRLTKLETAFSTPKTAERATQDPESKPNPQTVNAPAIAIIAENLVQKIASGAPYATEVAALEKLGADKPKLAVLQVSASTGVATVPVLTATFDRLTPTLLASEKPASPQHENVFARLMDHASGLVHIRKIGDLSGTDLAARIARVKDALAHEDTAAALKEWGDFPEAAKTTSAQWAEAAKARVVAMAGAKAIASDAMTNLTKVKS